MARSGYSISRYSSRRRRLAIAQGDACASHDSLAHVGRIYPPSESPSKELLKQKADSEGRETWLFLGSRDPNASTTAGSQVDAIGTQIRRFRNRRRDVLIDATSEVVDFRKSFAGIKTMLGRFQPDFVVVLCGDLIARSNETQGPAEIEKTLIAIVQLIERMKASPILCIPGLDETVGNLEFDTEVILELIRSVSAEHNACLVDCSGIEPSAEATEPNLRSQSRDNHATISEMFRVLLSEVSDSHHAQEPALNHVTKGARQ